MKRIVYICPKCGSELLSYTTMGGALFTVMCTDCGGKFEPQENDTVEFVPFGKE